ncbi:putative holin-like toxin [Paenibacillus thailandensis]|uniref:Holin-like toxin n=1 Tax=Paenibacillus thailandensis TaxID=393250 RepID=A0ABW5QXR6_9BACL
MEIKEALTLMLSFGTMLIGLLALVVSIVTAINQNKKK